MKCPSPPGAVPAAQRRVGRGATLRPQPPGGPGLRGEAAAVLRAGPGAGRRALCAWGRELGRAGPGRAAAGLSRRQPPGRLHFVGRAGGRGGREGGPGERGAPERPLCLPHPGDGGCGGCGVRAAGDALSWAARAPASRATSGLALPRPAPRLQHAAIWRLARPGLAPKVGWEPRRFARWFQSLVLGGGWGRGRVCENKELPSTHRSFFWRKVLQQDCLV